jgi:hypothetical protein
MSLKVAVGHELLQKAMAGMILHCGSQPSLFVESLSMYQAELHNHRRGLDTILDCSAGVSKIVRLHSAAVPLVYLFQKCQKYFARVF